MRIFSTPLPYYAADADAGGGAGADVKDPGADAGADAGAGAGDQGAGDDAGDKGGDKSGSFLDGADKVEDKTVVAPADFPEDWRDKMAGDDKELRKALDRYKSPADVAKANRDAQVKLRSGKPAADEPMPDAEKEPEKAKEWRQARGIPDDPTGYEVPDAVKSLVTDADKPKLAEFTEEMHKLGMPKSAVGPVMEWYFKNDAANREAIATADRADASEVEETLRSEYGAEFRPNVTLAKRFAEEITPGLNWFSARLPDGRLLGNVPEFVKALANLGSQEYGDVAFAGGEASNRTMARKEELEAMLENDPTAYFANPKYSKELESIIEAEQKRGGKR